MRTDGRTNRQRYRHDEVVDFRNFAKAPKNILIKCELRVNRSGENRCLFRGVNAFRTIFYAYFVRLIEIGYR
jgi:hypothetical protein